MAAAGRGHPGRGEQYGQAEQPVAPPAPEVEFPRDDLRREAGGRAGERGADAADAAGRAAERPRIEAQSRDDALLRVARDFPAPRELAPAARPGPEA